MDDYEGVTYNRFFTRYIARVECPKTLKGLIECLHSEPPSHAAQLDVRLNNAFTGGHFHTKENTASLISALNETAHTIRLLELRMEARLGPADQPQVDLLCDAIANMKHIDSLWWYGNENDVLAMPRLAHILTKARRLKFLICTNVSFQGDTSAFARFAKTFDNRRNLRKVEFAGCSIPREMQSTKNITPLLSALATMPRLEYLKLGCWMPPITPPPANDVATIAPGYVKDLTAAFLFLKTFASLHTLSLELNLEVLLEHQLNENDWAVIQHCISSLSIAYVTVVVKDYNALLHDEILVKAIEGLKRNTKMRKLTLKCRRRGAFSEAISNAAASILEKDNFTLRGLLLLHGNSFKKTEAMEKIKFYSDWNMRGRETLLRQDASRECWLYALEQARDNVAMSHAILLCNPELCDLSPKQADDAKEPPRKRRKDDPELKVLKCNHRMWERHRKA